MDTHLKLPPINCNTYINATPQKVYETPTTAKGWDGWFTQSTEIDARSGGSFLLKWVDFKVERYTTESGGPVPKE